MNIKSRKQQLEKIAKQAQQDAIVKKAAEEADLQAADSGDYSDKVFDNLLESILNGPGLED